MASAFEEAFQKAKAAKALKAAKAVTLPDDGAQVLPEVRNEVRAEWASELLLVTPMPVERQLAAMVSAPGAAEPVVAVDLLSDAVPDLPGVALPSNGTTVQPRRSNRAPARPHGYQSIPADFKAPQSVRLLDRRSASPPRYLHLRDATPLPAPAPDVVTLAFSPNASMDWQGGSPVTSSLFRQPADLGRLVSMATGKGAGVREVVLGFDFGTSSSKVVVGDRALRQAYAVPFRDAVGIDTFLLPARLYEDLGSYSLHGGLVALTDLKLSLMASPGDPMCQERVVAYLALAIREVRGWLFSVHAETYAKTQVLWSLALGQPADQATPGALTQLFKRLATVAWALAGSAGEITTRLCAKSLQEANDSGDADQDQGLEVIVMPEIAAQIFGFVSSNQFDAKDRNIYLIADVGAGTVDSCLFRVVPGRGGSWSFEVYTAAVEPTGVMNLHRHRVAWWQRELKRYPQGVDLGMQFEAIKLATEHQSHIPDSFEGYVKGVTAGFSGRAVGPDRDFFTSRLMAQVKGRTLHRAFSQGLLPQQDLSGVPFFLCGGGSRLGFYQACHETLSQTTGTGLTWLSARKRELAIPNGLRADGLKRGDFDRLSVAYGLSMMNLANVAAATPMPRLSPEPSDQWRSHYVDKDQV